MSMSKSPPEYLCFSQALIRAKVTIIGARCPFRALQPSLPMRKVVVNLHFPTHVPDRLTDSSDPSGPSRISRDLSLFTILR